MGRHGCRGCYRAAYAAGMTRPVTIPEPPWWTPRTGAPRRSLSRESIVAAGLAILRGGGIDAMSMRRVAAELGTGAASLYAHVAHKDELLELVFDEVVAEIPLPVPDPSCWQQQIIQLCVASRTALVRNGDIARVAIGRVPVGPNALRIAEATMTILRSGGVPDPSLGRALEVIGRYVCANAISATPNADRRRDGAASAEGGTPASRYLATLPAAQFPTITAFAPFMETGSRDERFRFGLELIMAGLAAQADADWR